MYHKGEIKQEKLVPLRIDRFLKGLGTFMQDTKQEVPDVSSLSENAEKVGIKRIHSSSIEMGQYALTLAVLWVKFSADDILIYFSYFSQKQVLTFHANCFQFDNLH